MMDLSHQVLRTDVSGMPLEWVGYQDAVRLYHLEQVAYTLKNYEVYTYLGYRKWKMRGKDG